MRQYYRTFTDAIEVTKQTLLKYGKNVEVGHWQGVDVKGKPDMVSFELLNHSFTATISPDIEELKSQIKPNLPWADDHFLERVGGIGINPGVQYAMWPYYINKANDKFRTEGGKFSHSYMERMWPTNLEDDTIWGTTLPHPVPVGIRYRYGDLTDVVDLLLREPLTRQAYLPIWFPEDTGSIHGGRVPCTLGYHFMLRDGELHMWYPIRACDFIRHFRDDIYLACRLLLWVLDTLKRIDAHTWNEVKPGKLTMQIYSLHCFVNDVPMLRKEDK